MHEHKLLFVGTPGVGKTSAIGAISDLAPICTDVPSSEEDRQTTVALDFGEVQLDDDLRLGLYGLPGQARFDFLWPMLAPGTLGVLLLLDARRAVADPDVDALLRRMDACLHDAELVVGVTHRDAAGATPTAEFRALLRRRGYDCPLIELDARDGDGVRVALRVLVARIEARALLA